jgi:hypothetical protein
MTPQQQATINLIKDYVTRWDCHNDDPDYEYKKFDVNETDDGRVEVYIITGIKNDEGTLAGLFCRIIRQIFVGRRAERRRIAIGTARPRGFGVGAM